MTFFSEPEISGNSNLLYYGFCDPALGRKEGDYSALVTTAIDQNGIIYVVDAVIERILPNALKEVILQRALRYKYVNLCIEDNGLTHSTNKKGRIGSI